MAAIPVSWHQFPAGPPWGTSPSASNARTMRSPPFAPNRRASTRSKRWSSRRASSSLPMASLAPSFPCGSQSRTLARPWPVWCSAAISPASLSAHCTVDGSLSGSGTSAPTPRLAASRSSRPWPCRSGFAPLPWLILRGVIGFGCSGIFITTESWLNAKAGSSERGRVFSVYMVGAFLALAAGQLLIGRAEIEKDAPLNVIAALFAVALVMASTTRAEPPRTTAATPLPFGQLSRAAPVAVTGCAVSGLIGSAFVCGGGQLSNTASISRRAAFSIEVISRADPSPPTTESLLSGRVPAMDGRFAEPVPHNDELKSAPETTNSL